MPTSKEPVYTALVSDALIECAQTNPNVLCNLRFEQRPISPTETPGERIRRQVSRHFDDSLVYELVRQFLKSLPPRSKVLLHFQGYSIEPTGTAVVEVQSIYWGKDDDYPRLDFEHPEAFKRIHGCPNFWGAFILAIALVPPSTEVSARRDRTGNAFIRMANQMAIPIVPISACI